MSYFNLFHILMLLLIIAMFGGFTYLIILKEKRVKIAISFIIANVAVMSSLAIISMILIDKYTKVAVIDDLYGKRTLINETISYSGVVKNVGYGYINSCVMNIELINTPVKKLEASAFENRGFFQTYIGSSHSQKGSQKAEFLIVKDLASGEQKSFSFTMPYPAHFKNHTTNYTLNCK
ncbi:MULTISPECIES: DUF2393 family protein [Campylobacter]|uniref:DUF2393 domain protein n=1 Tax=Campylobacter vicugnae TaxID=1660076 RepID=A0A1X9SZH4_9BACT|nr:MULTISPECIES: DUF2393 family protein [Campylobacter]MCR8690789.1 DUF2393 domain-containing protein [Campylobacter sp. RM9264]MCR8701827.1 DUF2393 domain-containing protein [Campylobacter sp. RM12176]ARR01668.1 DUF2393 domain protein [Campylobacter sp. RM8964]ARR03392.1 DUF2393 domain protein [Campylobacter sp. RM12175]MBQ7135590.1 DUF2393 family protein [Campylobacter sp.]